MKIDVVKTPPFVNHWVIDERGFKKLGSKPLNNAQTAPSMLADRVRKKGLNVVQPLDPSIK